MKIETYIYWVFMYDKYTTRLYIACIHRLNKSKFCGRSSHLLGFSGFSFFKTNKTQSVLILQKWIANQNVFERIKNKQSTAEFSFSASVFRNMDLKSANFRKKMPQTGFHFFPFRRLLKYNSD